MVVSSYSLPPHLKQHRCDNRIRSIKELVSLITLCFGLFLQKLQFYITMLKINSTDDPCPVRVNWEAGNYHNHTGSRVVAFKANWKQHSNFWSYFCLKLNTCRYFSYRQTMGLISNFVIVILLITVTSIGISFSKPGKL